MKMLHKKNKVLFSGFFLTASLLYAETNDEEIAQAAVFLKNLLSTQKGFHIVSEIVNDSGFKLYQKEGFGGWSISQELFAHILKIVPQGKTILELGSGWASGKLAEHYTVYSVEHDKSWVGRYATNYIYAPIKNGWYDIDVLKNSLPQNYDLILVDGPTGKIGRYGFYMHLSLFKDDVPIIIDDVNRDEEFILLRRLTIDLGRKALLIPGAKKLFAVIIPNKK